MAAASEGNECCSVGLSQDASDRPVVCVIAICRVREGLKTLTTLSEIGHCGQLDVDDLAYPEQMPTE